MAPLRNSLLDDAYASKAAAADFNFYRLADCNTLEKQPNSLSGGKGSNKLQEREQ